MLLTLLKLFEYAMFCGCFVDSGFVIIDDSYYSYDQCYELPFQINFVKHSSTLVQLRLSKKATHVPKVPTPAVEQLVEGRYKWEVSSHLVLVHTTNQPTAPGPPTD